MLNLKPSPADKELCYAIAERARKVLDMPDKLATAMDIAACHLNGNPLRLQDLLDAPEATFGHDVLGICRFIDRNTGKLAEHFVPRTTAPELEPQA